MCTYLKRNAIFASLDSAFCALARRCTRGKVLHMTLSGLCVGFHTLTLMLLVANVARTKLSKKPEKSLKPWHMGTHL